MSRADELIKNNRIVFSPKLGTFTTKGTDDQPRVVTLFPEKYSCSLNSCYHIQTVNYSLGMEMKGKARIPTDDLIPKNRRCRNQHSMVFQIPSASKDSYKKSFFTQTIRTGMPSLINTSTLLNCRTIAYTNSLPLLELGTNLPRPSPGEVLSFCHCH